MIKLLSSTKPGAATLGGPIRPSAGHETESTLDRLRHNAAFLRYQQAFETAVGMPLWIEAPAQPGGGAPVGTRECPSEHINPFCQKIFWNDNPCQACLDAHNQLAASPNEKASTLECFAGLKVTAVPIWQGQRILGYLRTGQVFTKQPSAGDFTRVSAILQDDDDISGRDLEHLRGLYFQGPATDDDHYEAMVQLLVFFAEQLAAITSRQPAAHTAEWPDPVRKVTAFMQRRFEHDHPLDDLAQVAGLSAHHLCAVFKEAVGITMTEYLNRERIHQAKKRLLSRYARVSEVCLEVGFGSLSQFNRCFLRYAGESPTSYRQRVLNRDFPST